MEKLISSTQLVSLRCYKDLSLNLQNALNHIYNHRVNRIQSNPFNRIKSNMNLMESVYLGELEPEI